MDVVVKLAILHRIANLLLCKSSESGLEDFIIDDVDKNIFDVYPWEKVFYDLTLSSF